MLEFLTNIYLWVGITIFFFLFFGGLSILYYLLIKKTHLMVELQAWMSGTSIGIFFQDNGFADWKPITPVNGVIYDEEYGPFVVTTTYVDKKTKSVIIPFDVDLDGDRTNNLKDLVLKFRNVTNNQNNISDLREAITNKLIDVKGKDGEKELMDMTSHIKISNLKTLFVNSVPHNVKSKIEKMVSKKLSVGGNVNPMHAILVFGSIFGIIIMGAILLKTAGGV